MVKNTSYMFVTGPDVIKAVTHEEVPKKSWAEPSLTRKNPAWRISPPKMIAIVC